MDSAQFDRITRVLGAGHARRDILRALFAAASSTTFMLLGPGSPILGKKKHKGGKKGKHKRHHRPTCAAAAKPTCDHSLCTAPLCDVQRREWICQNLCEGTSKPNCADGQCVADCDGAPELYECGSQCCNLFIHNGCCGGKCCRQNEVCAGGSANAETVNAETAPFCSAVCPATKKVCPAADGVDWTCCDEDQVCCHGECHELGAIDCGDHCCGPNSACCGSGCCQQGAHCSNDWCCADDRGPRCGTNTLCCNNPTDFCHGNECCFQGVDICDETCCPSWAPRCSTCPDGAKTCCADGESCQWDSAGIGFGCR